MDGEITSMTFAVEVTVDGSSLVQDELGRIRTRAIPKMTDDLALSFIRRMTDALRESAVANNVEFTTNLIDSINWRKTEGSKERVVYQVTMPTYGHYVDKGTAPGYLIPDNPDTRGWAERKLTWAPIQDRFYVFRRIVEKRGTRGKNWINPALQQEAQAWRDTVKEILNREL